MKTPEEMAEEYADSRLSGNGTYEYGMRQGFLAGYQAAKDTYKDAIDTYKDVAKQMLEEAVRIMSPKDQLADTSKEMNSPEKLDSCEHILDMDKMVDVNSSNNSNGWISVKERLPEPNISVLVWFRKRIALAAIDIKKDEFIQHGQYTLWKALKLNKDDIYEAYPWNEITHWLPLPEAPKEEG